METINHQQAKMDAFALNLFLSFTLDECLRQSYTPDELPLKQWMIDQIISAGETILGVMPEA